jgi:hypothetical protein
MEQPSSGAKWRIQRILNSRVSIHGKFNINGRGCPNIVSSGSPVKLNCALCGAKTRISQEDHSKPYCLHSQNIAGSWCSWVFNQARVFNWVGAFRPDWQWSKTLTLDAKPNIGLSGSIVVLSNAIDRARLTPFLTNATNLNTFFSADFGAPIVSRSRCERWNTITITMTVIHARCWLIHEI